MEVIMTSSLPACPSLEQLKKMAKDLAKQHEEKQPDALALIARHLPAPAGKSAVEIAAYPFALHDAQSVIARQYGFPGWNELQSYLAQAEKNGPSPSPSLEIAAKLQTVLSAREKIDYALFCSVMNAEMKAFVTKERFEQASERMSAYFQADYQTTYMGSVSSRGLPVHFWRMWVKGWDSDLLIRMVVNDAGHISGLLYSGPFDSAKK
jgi:hypothetical protein